MTKFNSLLFIAVLLGFAALGHAGSDDADKLIKTKRLDYELQERCGQTAERLCNQDRKENRDFEVFLCRNHYNSKLNKCFILKMFSKTMQSPITMVIEDANEHSTYGYCGEQALESKSSGLGPHNCNSQEWLGIRMNTMEE